MREVKIRAIHEHKKLKDAIAEFIRKGMAAGKNAGEQKGERQGSRSLRRRSRCPSQSSSNVSTYTPKIAAGTDPIAIQLVERDVDGPFATSACSRRPSS